MITDIEDLASQIDPAEFGARLHVLEEARSWLRTPFHHEARVKGSGVDCAMLIAEVYERVRLIPHVEPEHYPHDWHLHRSEEKYLAWIDRYAREVDEPLAGDIAIFKIGRTWSHAGIVMAWPVIIHAWFSTTVEYNETDKEPLRSYPHKFYRLNIWK